MVVQVVARAVACRLDLAVWPRCLHRVPNSLRRLGFWLLELLLQLGQRNVEMVLRILILDIINFNTLIVLWIIISLFRCWLFPTLGRGLLLNLEMVLRGAQKATLELFVAERCMGVAVRHFFRAFRVHSLGAGKCLAGLLRPAAVLAGRSASGPWHAVVGRPLALAEAIASWLPAPPAPPRLEYIIVLRDPVIREIAQRLVLCLLLQIFEHRFILRLSISQLSFALADLRLLLRILQLKFGVFNIGH